MKQFSFKYYPPKILILFLLIVIVLFLVIHGLLSQILHNELPGFWKTVLLIISSTGIIGSVFYVFNLYGLNALTAKVFDLPVLNGKYEGKLISQYYINNDPQKPKVTKFARFSVSQNLNGFYMIMQFFDTGKSKTASSQSHNITDQIESLGNGTYRITYQYINDPDKTHKDEERYGLNLHRGITELVFDPKEGSLKGQYWNNPKDRSSFGTIELKRIK